jgi:hypothetical protein
MDEARKPGRPRLDAAAPSASVHLKLPASVYDSVYQARKQGESVQDVIRRHLRRLAKDERGGTI